MAYGIPVSGIPNAGVLVEIANAQEANKNKGIGGWLSEILSIGIGAGANKTEPLIEANPKPDYTIYYVVAGVIVLLGGLYFFTRKKGK
jgi:hypothetical protein